MSDIVLIIGPSGSGKSRLQSKLVDLGFSVIISSTSRVIREGEIDGVDYNFKKDKEDFFKDEYIEHAQVGECYYGTPRKEFYKSDKIAHVIEPYGAYNIIETFKQDATFNIKVVYMNIDEETCVNNIKGEKGFLTEAESKRLERDKIDSIPSRLKEKKIVSDMTISNLDYDEKEVLGLFIKETDL